RPEQARDVEPDVQPDLVYLRLYVIRLIDHRPSAFYSRASSAMGGSMRTRAIFVGTVLTAAIVAVFAAQPGAQGGQYSFIKEIKIGGDGGWDYLNVDSAAKRLYVSHATKAVVVDTAKDAVIG